MDTIVSEETVKVHVHEFRRGFLRMDGRIPHVDRGAVREILESAKSRAKMFDGVDGAYTLRLRERGGLIRTAGDLAVVMGDDKITGEHMKNHIFSDDSANEIRLHPRNPLGFLRERRSRQ